MIIFAAFLLNTVLFFVFDTGVFQFVVIMAASVFVQVALWVRRDDQEQARRRDAVYQIKYRSGGRQ